ncbi:DUF559 domain-containing protein [Rothia sp. P5764]|uniref:DUF559 domain-containing protein n=1 Tax=Rothia sp. P5764 TaxID=3402654 RepID=UPI003AD58518
MEDLFTTIKTSAELRHQGVSSAAITRKSKNGELIKICFNAYVEANQWKTWDATRRCLARHVGFLKTHRGYVLSHVSAALWWRAPTLDLPLKVWVSHPHPSAKVAGNVHLSRNRLQVCEQAVFRSGAFVTTPLQTALDCARVLPCPDALCIIDDLLHRDLVQEGELSQALKTLEGRGALRAREITKYMSAKAESPAESLARYWILLWGFTAPVEQVQLWVKGNVYRPDFLWEDTRVILEVDGMVKYSGTYGSPVEVIQKERRRQHHLELLGYTVIRAQWEDVARNPENLRAKLVRAGVR